MKEVIRRINPLAGERAKKKVGSLINLLDWVRKRTGLSKRQKSLKKKHKKNKGKSEIESKIKKEDDDLENDK
jgi:hypothetical protein